MQVKRLEYNAKMVEIERKQVILSALMKWCRLLIHLGVGKRLGFENITESERGAASSVGKSD